VVSHQKAIFLLIPRSLLRGVFIDAQVEIRYVVPTGPTGETTPFCHLCLDYLDLKPQTVIVHKWRVGEFQVTAEQEDMGVGLCAQVGLDDDDDMQRLRELLVQQVRLVYARLDLSFYGCLLEVLRWHVGIIHLATVLATRPPSGIGAGVGEVQCGIAPQFGNQVQVALLCHLHGVVVAEVPVQYQGGQRDNPGD
jgi:hypothetical protein